MPSSSLGLWKQTWVCFQQKTIVSNKTIFKKCRRLWHHVLIGNVPGMQRPLVSYLPPKQQGKENEEMLFDFMHLFSHSFYLNILFIFMYMSTLSACTVTCWNRTSDHIIDDFEPLCGCCPVSLQPGSQMFNAPTLPTPPTLLTSAIQLVRQVSDQS